jgi:uncharacterized protein (DUF58 family)
MSRLSTARSSARSALRSAGAASTDVLARVERKVGITSTGLSVAAVAVLLFVFARTADSPGLFMLTYGALTVLGLAFLLARRTLSVETVRSELPTRVRLGQTVSVRLGLTANRALATVLLEEELSDALGNTVRVPVALLPAGETITHSYDFTPRRRGVFTVGPLVATWTDPFGMTRRRTVLAEAVELIVHPTVESAHDRVISREWEDPPVRPPVTRPWPVGYEFYGLRDYADGDDPRRIVWRATARSLDLETGEGRYLVRESEQGITDRVTLVLDTDLSHHSPGLQSETFETAVKVVSSVTDRHLKDGFTVTIEGNAARLGRPTRSRREGVRLFDELARVDAGKETLRASIERILLGGRRDTHIMIVTPHITAEAAARLRLLTDRGVNVLIVLVVWDGTDPVAMHRAARLGCSVVEVSAQTPLDPAFSNVIRQVAGR